jgi:hypothetical protein
MILDIDSLDKAFGRPDQERFNRLDELDRIRIQNREKRRDSALVELVPSTGTVSIVRLRNLSIDLCCTLLLRAKGGDSASEAFPGEPERV